MHSQQRRKQKRFSNTSFGATFNQSPGSTYCPFCKETFPDMSYFRSHMANLHNDQMPFSCSLCGRGYLSASGLARHMQSHRGKTFTCPICDSRFTQKFTIKPHLRTVHGLEQCTACSMLFKLGFEFNQHVLTCGNFGMAGIS